MKGIISPEIHIGGSRRPRSLHGEGKNMMTVMQGNHVASGVRTHSMLLMDSLGTREIRKDFAYANNAKQAYKARIA